VTPTTDADLVVFQQLGLAVRSRILKEGSVVFVRDEQALYALATRTARAFEGSGTSTGRREVPDFLRRSL
jgi:hypothetical protein